ncbi:MAG TPA: DUF6569 family protein [Pyrinomonadaceae bacterium]
MSKQSYGLAFGALIFAIGVALVLVSNGQERTRKTEAASSDSYILSGPYSYKNLSIFLLHAKQNPDNHNFLTLQEALEQKKVIVYETKNVNELAIENTSDQDVYVQSGDIVKGGQQDRMIGVDLIVPPKSGRIPLAAFCVEHGRWSGRGNELAGVFSSSADAVSTKEIKLAAKRSNSQGDVWQNVKAAQDKLSQSVGAPVNSPVSESSLQLAVENPKVQETAEGYINTLSRIVVGKDDVIGFAFAINGEVNSADVYASNTLFRKLWPKLLKATAIEAIAELDPQKNVSAPSAEQLSVFLSKSEQGSLEEKNVTERVTLATRENESSILFETRDRKQKDGWVHRNYIRK